MLIVRYLFRGQTSITLELLTSLLIFKSPVHADQYSVTRNLCNILPFTIQSAKKLKFFLDRTTSAPEPEPILEYISRLVACVKQSTLVTSDADVDTLIQPISNLMDEPYSRFSDEKDHNINKHKRNKRSRSDREDNKRDVFEENASFVPLNTEQDALPEAPSAPAYLQQPSAAHFPPYGPPFVNQYATYNPLPFPVPTNNLSPDPHLLALMQQMLAQHLQNQQNQQSNNNDVYNLSLEPQHRLPTVKAETARAPDIPTLQPTQNIEEAIAYIKQLKSELVKKSVPENINPGTRSLELMKLGAALPATLEFLFLNHVQPEPTVPQLQSLGQYTNLKILHIHNSKTFTTTVSSVLTSLTSLLELDLTNCINVNSTTLQPFAVCTKLVTLCIAGCYNVDFSVGNLLEKLPNLTCLNLSETKIRNRTLDKIRHSSLTSLQLKQCKELSDDLQQPNDSSFSRLLGRAPGLTELNVSGCHKLSAALNQISICHNLRRLDVSDTILNKKQLQQILESNPNLECLNVTNCQLTDNDICDDAILKLMGNIQQLFATGIVFTDNNYGMLTPFFADHKDKIHAELENCKDLFIDPY